MKKPNGYGSVYKLSGRRRNPWRVVVSVGYSPDGKRIRRTVGYFSTKKEALNALGVYNAAPYSLERLTFEDVYKSWFDERSKEVSEMTAEHYKIAYNHSAALWKKKFADLRTLDLENCIKAESEKPSVQLTMKSLYNQLWKYALRYDWTSRNYASEVKIARQPETAKRRPFTTEEINSLWELLETEKNRVKLRTIRMILIGIYSGWRPSEICKFELDGDLMRGGLKTKAGKDRIVPVHPLIADIVKQDRCDLYVTYKMAFDSLMQELGWSHTPHDTRRTFASLAAEANMNENIRKLILGHENPNFTERVYTTHKVDELRREMAKIGRI